MSCINTAKSIVADLIGMYGNSKELSSIANELNSIASEVTDEEKQAAKERLEKLNKKNERKSSSNNSVNFKNNNTNGNTPLGSSSTTLGIEIKSDSDDPLGKKLTNVHFAHNGKSDFDITPSKPGLKNPSEVSGKWFKDQGEKSAKAAWGLSVEAWYKANKNDEDEHDTDLMRGLIVDKLTQYPELVQQIDERGGVAFLENSTHNVGTRTNRWGTNGGNLFMKTLIEAYKITKWDYSGIYTYSKDGKKHTLEFTLNTEGTYNVTLDSKPINARAKYEVRRIIKDRGAVKQDANTTPTTGTVPSEEDHSDVKIIPVGNYSVLVQENAITEEEKRTFTDNIDFELNRLKNTPNGVVNWNNQQSVWYGPVPYTYSAGRGNQVTHSQKSMPEWLQELGERASKLEGKPPSYYNSVLINRFVNGKGLGAHRDSETIFTVDDEAIGTGYNKMPKTPIGSVAVFSIGNTVAPHRFGEYGKELPVKVNDMSLNIMSSGNLRHEVAGSDGIRYSITFRHVPSTRIPATDPGVEVSPAVLGFVQSNFGGKASDTVSSVQTELRNISLNDILSMINNNDNQCIL